MDWIESLQETTIALSTGTIADPLRPPLPPIWGSICPHDTWMAISPQRVIWYTSCLVLGRVFRVVGSNGAISGYIKSKMAASRHLGKFWMAISPHISAKGHAIHLMLRFYDGLFRAPMLYNMHRAVILAIAQLSGFIYQHYFFCKRWTSVRCLFIITSSY